MQNDELLKSLSDIIRFTGIPRRTFYDRGYAKKLKESGYVFSRSGKYGQKIYWSYRGLIIAWLLENFSCNEKKDEIAQP